MNPVYSPVEQIVKTYKSKYRVFWWQSPQSQFTRDAARLAQHGWRVISQSTRKSMYARLPLLTVTYERVRQPQ